MTSEHVIADIKQEFYDFDIKEESVEDDLSKLGHSSQELKGSASCAHSLEPKRKCDAKVDGFHFPLSPSMNESKKRRVQEADSTDILDDDGDKNPDVSMTSELSDDNSSDSDSNSSYYEDQASDSDDSFAYPANWTGAGNERPPFTFTANAGVKFDIENKNDPSEFFEKFFDHGIFEHIKNETNRSAKQYLEANSKTLSAKSRMQKWYDTSVEELKVLFALLILQGVDSKSHNSMYFSKRESVRNCLYPKVINGRRFEMLIKFLHFHDNTSKACKANADERKLAKIQPLIHMLLPKFMGSYVPKKNISVDESQLGGKGRLSWTEKKQFGIKFYELCESASGYVWNVIIYTGADTKFNEKYKDLPVTDKIVYSLCDPLLDKGYCLYVYNLYTNLALVDGLVQRQTDCIGTCSSNTNDFPKVIKVKKLKEGETVVAFRKKSMVLKWKDKKDVTVLSTIHDNSMMCTALRRGKESQKPKVIANYNENMSIANLSDSLICHLTTARNRMKKIYMKIFRYFLDITVLNAYITYKELGGKMNRCEFIITLSENMIMKNKPQIPNSTSSAGIPFASAAKPSRLIGRHFPDYCPPSGKRAHAPRRCAQCSKKKVSKCSCYWCPDCKVALCVAPCFRLWHTCP